MMPRVSPDWKTCLSALATPTNAIFGLLFIFFQIRRAKDKQEIAEISEWVNSAWKRTFSRRPALSDERPLLAALCPPRPHATITSAARLMQEA